jgi:DNA repair protein RadA/Sms
VLSLAPDPEERRIPTGFPGVDRVLGGGLVPGSVVLLAGEPGIGKSTLLLQLASSLTAAGHPCLLASGEEARGQVAARAHRLGLPGETLSFTPGRDLQEVLGTAERERPAALVVDSIHTIRSGDSETLPGGVAQVRACTDALGWLAKQQGITVILIGHVTKEGDLAGPRTLEHAVDTVMTFEGDPATGRRVLAGGKNRFGPEGEVAWFEMTASGLQEVEAGPRIGEGEVEPGCATALTMAGRRAFAVDIQALRIPGHGPPRRQVSGLDPRRFHIIAAVTDRAMGLGLAGSELFGAVAGGLRLDDPGADLAVAAALGSTGASRSLPPAGFVGEVSLTGSVRPVSGLEQRLSAGAAAGLPSVVVGAWGSGPKPKVPGRLQVIQVSHVREALSWAFRR